MLIFWQYKVVIKSADSAARLSASNSMYANLEIACNDLGQVIYHFCASVASWKEKWYEMRIVHNSNLSSSGGLNEIEI